MSSQLSSVRSVGLAIGDPSNVSYNGGANGTLNGLDLLCGVPRALQADKHSNPWPGTTARSWSISRALSTGWSTSRAFPVFCTKLFHYKGPAGCFLHASTTLLCLERANLCLSRPLPRLPQCRCRHLDEDHNAVTI